MSRQIDLTLQGIVGTSPVLSRTTGNPFCRFRVAVTPSHREGATWIDEPTIWFTAKAWGALAENLSFSLAKGDPVLMTGRFSQETWNGDRGAGFSNVINLSSAGHDLSRGESRFGRLVRSSRTEPGEGETTAQGHEQATSEQLTDTGQPADRERAEAQLQTEPGEPVSVPLVGECLESVNRLDADSQVSSELPDSSWELPVDELEGALA
ncbi:Helix-destabilizing protein [Actinomyces bovis]|uniref:Helix-destabilizing protein n=1 Tax=Actinomyces bovis TaxID=1658 RepID=A0ABY1VPT7_9ACTO|nr:single-stranded DNA-binding protein [Actinomyces bovis]SPT53813.1 Helix-destabilizing protein [Actinomyces bovis]VEG53176.1 Helix-destabilizing protein [Actinomyces israelii]